MTMIYQSAAQKGRVRVRVSVFQCVEEEQTALDKKMSIACTGWTSQRCFNGHIRMYYG